MLDSGCFFGVCRNFGEQWSVAVPNLNEAIGLWLTRRETSQKH